MWVKPDIFEVKPLASSWSSWVAPKQENPEWADDVEKKKLFGTELAKGYASQFLAACQVFPDDNSGALWVSINWLNDPIVLAARDIYLKTVQADTSLLDKNQLSTTLLSFANERLPNGYPAAEASDRLKALELYAKIQGFLKPDNATTNNFTHNSMKLLIVEADKKPKDKAIDSIDHTIIDNDPEIVPLPLRIASV